MAADDPTAGSQGSAKPDSNSVAGRLRQRRRTIWQWATNTYAYEDKSAKRDARRANRVSAPIDTDPVGRPVHSQGDQQWPESAS